MSNDIQHFNQRITFSIGDAFNPDGRRSFEIEDSNNSESTISLIVLPHQANALSDLLKQIGATFKPLEY